MALYDRAKGPKAGDPSEALFWFIPLVRLIEPFEQFAEDPVALRTVAGDGLALGQLRGDLGRQRHEIVAMRYGCMVKFVKCFERMVVGAKPERWLVGHLVGKRLQEISPKRRVVADDGLGVERPRPVTVPVTVIV